MQHLVHCGPKLKAWDDPTINHRPCVGHICRSKFTRWI